MTFTLNRPAPYSLYIYLLSIVFFLSIYIYYILYVLYVNKRRTTSNIYLLVDSLYLQDKKSVLTQLFCNLKNLKKT